MQFLFLDVDVLTEHIFPTFTKRRFSSSTLLIV